MEIKEEHIEQKLSSQERIRQLEEEFTFLRKQVEVMTSRTQ